MSPGRCGSSYSETRKSRGRFRCRMWQAEYFRIQSSVPSGPDGAPRDEPSNELILVRFSGPKMDDYDDFTAADPGAALATVLRDFSRFLEHTTLQKAE